MSCKSPDKEPLLQIRPRQAPRHWRSLEELGGARGASTEFPGGLPAPGAKATGSDASRRDFLTLMGFSVAAATAASCRAPTQHAVPLAVGSDTIIPGVANYYATTCGGCSSGCGLLVKQRDGRPIKVDGNDESPLFGGGTCAAGQATVLSLYDDERLRGPQMKGQATDWAEVDRHMAEAVERARREGKKVVLLSGTITSPSTRAIIAEWGGKLPAFRHVTWDAVSAGALRAGAERSFGAAVTPHYAFDRARVIVALEADFLGTWLSPVEFGRQYAAFRKPSETDATPPLHVQIESGLSLTGSNADRRVAVAPSQVGAVAVALLARVARRAGAGGLPDAPVDGVEAKRLDEIAESLWSKKGQSLVVTGSPDPNVQVVVNALNSLLGNVGAGKPVDLGRPSLQKQGDDAAVAALINEMSGGGVGVLIVWGANPAYDHPQAARFREGLRKVGFSVSLSDRRDETSAETTAVAPDHHFLEAWGDAEPVAGYYSLAQPLIAPLFGTRAAQESLLRWMGAPSADYHERLRDHWKTVIFATEDAGSFQSLWDKTLQRGFLAQAAAGGDAAAKPVAFKGDAKKAAAAVLASCAAGGAGYELHLYESVGVRDGSAGNNPWLQELPDPITKVTWGNFAAMAPSLAAKLDVEQGDVVALKTSAGEIALPVLLQPGQHARTISVALGYGRTHAGKVGNGVGANAFALAGAGAGGCLAGAPVTVTKTGRRKELASTQKQFRIEDERPIVQEVSLRELQHGGEKKGHGEHGGGEHGGGEHAAGEHGEGAEEKRPGVLESLPNIWKERLSGDHSWGMAIDTNVCTGCSACVVSCQAENNIPVVGEDQVRRNRIMHWMRIDHYYTGSVDDPSSIYQPMMCQHCLHAPCETVCPVLATTTSSEGINQQTYNRCIGTRYCANNCPYKVRRFNWHNYTENDDFDFNMTSPLGRMVLNPDVTVRSRGVMEKCSLCVQRVQLGKNTALKERREIADGDVQTACQQSCPTGAIVFGDLQDPHSRVSKLLGGPRAYLVLEDLGTRPSVGYLKKVRNVEET